MVDIHIVGLGVLSVDHVTRETEDAIRNSNEVLYVDTGVATGEFLETLCPKVTAIFDSSYSDSEHRLNAYQLMAARVVDAALQHAPVTFAMQGHPTVGVYAPFLINDMAGVLGLSVRTLPGISALDCMFAELMIDPCVMGMQMYEATDLLLRCRPLQPDVHAMIWQVGCVETRLYSMRVSRPLRFERLQAHLLQFYPADHEVTLFFATPHPLMRSTCHRFPLGALCEHAHVIHAGFTLLLPASGERPVVDAALRQQVDSVDHLQRITL